MLTGWVRFVSLIAAHAQLLCAQDASTRPIGTTLVTEVCDVLGEPIVNALLEVRSRTGGSLLRSSRSDGSGLCVLAGIPDEPTALRVGAPGFAQFGMHLDPHAPHGWDQAQRIELLEAGHVHGVVRGAGGAPLAGAMVEAFGHPERAVTDAQGRYALDAIPLGRQRIYVTKQRHGPYLREVEFGPDATQDFALAPSDDGAPVTICVEPPLFAALGGRATVHVEFEGLPQLCADLICDATGTVKVEGLYGGRLEARLDAAPPEIIVPPVFAFLPKDAGTPVRIVRSSTPITHEVRGRLIDPAGKGVARTTLRLGHGTGKEVTVVTDAEGGFRGVLDRLPQTRVYPRLTPGPWVGTAASVHGFEPDASGAIVVAVEPSCTVHGVVKDTLGNALPYASVHLLSRDRANGWAPLGMRVRSGADGTFAFEGLRADPADFEVRARFGDRSGVESDVVFPTPGTRTQVTVVVRPVGKIVGTLLDGKDPAPNSEIRFARITPGGAMLPYFGVRTDRRGRFQARGLPPGRYAVFVLPFFGGHGDPEPATTILVDGPGPTDLGELTSHAK